MSLDPIAKNDVWATLAALQRRLRQLESVSGGGGFRTGDYLDSERAHPDFVAGVLSDGGRPGWYLANGATNPDMATSDPELYAILGDSNVLPDYRGRVRVAPNGATFAQRGTVVGGVSSSFSLSTANLPAHTHGVGTIAISPNPHSHTVTAVPSVAANTAGGGGNWPNTQTSITTSETTLTLSGSTASAGSGSAVSVSVVQPTRTCGVTWIKR